MSKDREKFFHGAFVLTAAGLISRLLGALYRLPLASLLGDEGIGLYQMAYPIYTTLLALSTAGIPVAISKLVAEKTAQGKKAGALRVFRISLLILTAAGFVFSLVLFFGAEFIARQVLRDPRAYYAVVAVAPAVFLVAVMSSYRGFFQGLQTMVPTAVSQVLEQVVRVATVFVLAVSLLPRGIEFAAGGATFGAATGALAGLVFLLAVYWRDRLTRLREAAATHGQETETNWEIIYRIGALAIPVSIGGLILPLMQTLDTIIVPSRLQVAGYNVSEATALFGQLTGMAAPLINLPSIFTVALSTSLVPAISEALALKNFRQLRQVAYVGIRLTVMLALPAMLGLYLLAGEISFMLYKNAAAGIPLAIMAWGVLFFCLQQTSSGILQGLGRTILPVRNLFIGCLFKVFINYSLTAVPALGIRGAAFGTVAGFVVASGLNLFEAWRYVELKANIHDLLTRPLIAGGAMALAVRASYHLLYRAAAVYALSPRLQVSAATLPTVLIGAVVYILVLFLVGGISQADLELFGLSDSKTARLLKRAGLLRR